MTAFEGNGGLLAWTPFGFLFVAACAGSPRETVPPSTDTVAALPARSTEGYEYVARRPLAVVALAEARGLETTTVRSAIDHLADAVDACVVNETRRGASAGGAARVVAQIDEAGRVAAAAVRIDPGAGSAESAVLCFVAPAKLLTFPPEDAGARGLAIEAIWGPKPP